MHFTGVLITCLGAIVIRFNSVTLQVKSDLECEHCEEKRKQPGLYRSIILTCDLSLQYRSVFRSIAKEINQCHRLLLLGMHQRMYYAVDIRTECFMGQTIKESSLKLFKINL